MVEEFFAAIQPLLQFLSPFLAAAAAGVIALMEAVKKIDKKKKLKRFYWIIGLVLSGATALGITLLMETFIFIVFLFHFAIIFISQAGLDMGLLKPILKEAVPVAKKILAGLKKVKKIT